MGNLHFSDAESRVFGIGPQIGFIFPAATGVQGYLNLKGYYEFESHYRPDGWNFWATLAFTPAEKPRVPTSMVTKSPVWK